MTTYRPSDRRVIQIIESSRQATRMEIEAALGGRL
jgi:hypothetical protein